MSYGIGPAVGHARPASPAAGYPLGEPILYLRAIEDRMDASVSCSVENVYDQRLAAIVPRRDIPWFTREAADLHFEMIRPDGIPMLYLSRIGGHSGHRVHVYDPAGRELGLLRQTTTYGQLATGRQLRMQLEAGSNTLGATEIRFPWLLWPYRTQTVVEGAHGSALAAISRQYRVVGWRAPRYFDYVLDCPHPASEPVPTMLLAAAFTHYLYDRLNQGGPMRAIKRWA